MLLLIGLIAISSISCIILIIIKTLSTLLGIEEATISVLTSQHSTQSPTLENMASMEAAHPEDMQPSLCWNYGSISARDWKEISWALRDLSGHTLNDALEADSDSDTQSLLEVDEGKCSTHADFKYFRSIVSKESKSGSSQTPLKHLRDGCILCFFQPKKKHLYGHKTQSADNTQILKLGNNKNTTIIDVTSDAKGIYVPELEGTSLDHAFQLPSQNYIDGQIAYPEYSHRRQSIVSTEEEVDSAAETLFSPIPPKISHVASDKPPNVVTASKLMSEFLTANQALIERHANQGHDNITHQEDRMMRILKIAEKFLAAEAKRYEERSTDAQVSESRFHEEEAASLQLRENGTLASAIVVTTSPSDISSTSAETMALKISKTQRRREERKRARMLKAEKLEKAFITSVEI
ncbi:MAG: hypothetical protein Q9164_002928 [Protoblastenia rupestris]